MIRLTLRDSLFLGFCAALLVASRAAFRWHIGISGHSMFFTVFFLMLARGCVPFRWGATLTGFFAGVAAVALGLGKGGPLILLKFIFPAIAIDLGILLLPLALYRFSWCVPIAALAAASKFFGTALVDWLMGMDYAVLWQHALFEGVAAIPFGIFGSLLIPPVLKRLHAYGILSNFPGEPRI